jgi:hypothetical protein
MKIACGRMGIPMNRASLLAILWQFLQRDSEGKTDDTYLFNYLSMCYHLSSGIHTGIYDQTIQFSDGSGITIYDWTQSRTGATLEVI